MAAKRNALPFYNHADPWPRLQFARIEKDDGSHRQPDCGDATVRPAKQQAFSFQLLEVEIGPEIEGEFRGGGFEAGGVGDFDEVALFSQLGTNLEIAYFDQHRATLKDDQSVADNVADGNEFVTFEGKQRHVFSYLEDFLFSPERSRTPVRVLSGGERNRLLLARLFTQPFNVLVLDEPTNDRAEAIPNEIGIAYERWAELDKQSGE